MRSFSPPKAFTTEPLPLAAVPAETVGAPAPVAFAAGSGPFGDRVLVSALGVWAFSIAGLGATCANPATPLAEAACRGAWPMVPNVAAVLAAGLSMAACEAAAGRAARQASAPAAATIMMRFTNP